VLKLWAAFLQTRLQIASVSTNKSGRLAGLSRRWFPPHTRLGKPSQQETPDGLLRCATWSQQVFMVTGGRQPIQAFFQKVRRVFRGKVRTPSFSALSPAAAFGYPAGRVPPG
jgi:hypothetical protein